MSLSVLSLLVVLPAVAFTAPIDSGVIVEGNNDPVGRLLSLSQVAYTFLDRDVNEKVDRVEMEYLNGRSLNGMHFSNTHKVDEVFAAMDVNGDKIITLAEFIGFDKWLFTLLDTSKTRKINLKNFKEYSEKNETPEFVILDRNGNGYIEPEEMVPKNKHAQ